MSGPGHLSVAQLRQAVSLVRGDLQPHPVEVAGRGVAVVGASGGAGETYVAAALTASGCPAWATDHRWPTSVGPVLVVTRSSAAALYATQLMLGEHTGEEAHTLADVIGLAVVADAPGKITGALTSTIAALSAVVPAVWHIGFYHAWRHCLPDAIELDKTIARHLAPISAAVAAYYATADSADQQKEAS